MRVWKVLAVAVLAAPAAGCEVRPAVPVAALRLPAPVVVAPAYKPHPGRGWARGHW